MQHVEDAIRTHHVPPPKLQPIVERLMALSPSVKERWNKVCEGAANKALVEIDQIDPNTEDAADVYAAHAERFRDAKRSIMAGPVQRNLQTQFKRVTNKFFSVRSRTLKKKKEQGRDAELARALARISDLERQLRDQQELILSGTLVWNF